MALRVSILTMVMVAGVSAAPVFAQADPVLYARSGKTLFDGKFGKLADAQAAMNAALLRCGKPGIVSDGQFGKGTAQAVQALVDCAEIAESISRTSDARRGAITLALWNAILPQSAPPSVEDRAQTIVLTYEATDYDRLEWNFCQNRPLWTPDDPTKPCFSNDQRSYITWGPRGATAGHGAEIQWIIWRAEQKDTTIVDAAFAGEAATARVLLTLNDEAAKRLLCSIYADLSRRATWTSAFAQFGKSPVVRALYDTHYKSPNSDGAKMARLFRLYAALGVTPTEVDYAFFLDRATHSTPPADIESAAAKIRQRLTGAAATPSRVRRAFAAAFRTGNQSDDRLGRDVAFYIDAIPEADLTAEERRAWQNRGELRASDLGLSDERPAPPLPTVAVEAGPSLDKTMSPIPSCPESVLHPHTPTS